MGDLYIDVVKKAPRVFGAAYKLGMFVSRMAKKSPVYYVNTLMAKYLNRYLKEHTVDVIFMPHLYPSETISYMKKKGMPLPLTVAVMTDYTCIPFWEETCCDYYIVPHPELIEECARRGIPKEKMIPFGIPVRKCFRNLMDQEEAKEKLGFSPEKKLHLLIGGSMGAGNLEKLCDDLYMIHDGHIVFHEETDVLLSEYGLLKVSAQQYDRLDKRYLLRMMKESFGISCLTSEKRYYEENYPGIVIEKGSIDEMITMMVKGENVK